MFGWIMIIAAVIVMAKAAEMEQRSASFWGGLTFVLCLGCGVLIPLPLLNVGIGFILSFLIMFAAKIIGAEQ